MMVGYLLIAAILVLFVYYTYQHLRRFLRATKKGQEGVEKGYYLLSHTYEDPAETGYYGVFQQGEKTLTLEMSLQLYLHTSPPQRGELIAKDGKVIAFNT
jgi:hypothetical protein